MSNTVTHHFNEAISAFNNRNLKKAEQAFKRVVELDKTHIPALNLLTVVLMSSGRFEEAEKFIARAVQINQLSDVSFYNYGLILKHLNKPKLAFEQFTKALNLNGNVPDTWNNRGTISNDLDNFKSALLDFDRAILINPNYAEAYANKGKSLTLLKRYEEALATYTQALSIKPDLDGAWLGRGNVFCDLKRYDEALAAYDKALSIKPDLDGAWLGRGNVFCDLNRFDEALAAYDKALSLKPDFAEAWLGRGNVFYGLKRYDEAFPAYDKALSIKSDLNGVGGMRLSTKMHLSNWDNCETEIKALTSSIKMGKAKANPFALLALTDSAKDQLCFAKSWVKEKHPISTEPLWKGKIYKHQKIRLGYVSADFHKHATAYLMAECFELHDKTRFDTTAFSVGPDDNSDIRARLINSFNQFIDCRVWSDAAISRAVAEAEIDILIDLKGFTQNARTNVFAFRPAPIQVNYLGYPGTMGASYIDYIIGDKKLFNLTDAPAYLEKLVQLPNSYQPNDRKRIISDKSFDWKDFGLPNDRFVFCCFNSNYKILPPTFDSWMRILNAIEGSALWLVAENKTAIVRLKREAEVRGVDPGRLVFAKHMELPDHLARHRLADLFLDTLPYNAHTTASDALWAGLPVLTQIGNTFAGRVAASLLNAIGLPELITHSRDEYETMAIELALNRRRLIAIRKKLQTNRLTTPLFDTKLYTIHLESAYKAMYQRYQAGLPPDHIEVEPISVL